MKRVTKKEARERKAEWAKAVSEGRVLRFNDGLSFQSFASSEERDVAIARIRAAGLDAEAVFEPVKQSEAAPICEECKGPISRNDREQYGVCVACAEFP